MKHYKGFKHVATAKPDGQCVVMEYLKVYNRMYAMSRPSMMGLKQFYQLAMS